MAWNGNQAGCPWGRGGIGTGPCFICKMVQSIVLCAQKTLSTQGNYLDVCVYGVSQKAEVRNSPLRICLHLKTHRRRPELCRCCCGHFELCKFERDPLACDTSCFGCIICLRNVHTLLQKPWSIWFRRFLFTAYMKGPNNRVHANCCLPNLKGSGRQWEPQLQMCFSCDGEHLKPGSNERAELTNARVWVIPRPFWSLQTSYRWHVPPPIGDATAQRSRSSN